MKIKKIVFLLILITTNFTFSQEIQYSVTKDAIEKNDIYKIYQYNVIDSLKFIKDYPNGYYAIFDEEGRVKKANN